MDGTYTNISLLAKDISYRLLTVYPSNSVAYSQAWSILEYVDRQAPRPIYHQSLYHDFG